MSVFYFPEAYPDELHYSTIARTAQHHAFYNWKTFCLYMFGHSKSHPSPFFPTKLKCFSDRIPHDELDLHEKILMKHTLFPYYSAFERIDWRSKIAKRQIEGPFLNDLDLKRFKTTLPKTLRYCTACHADMLREVGEIYWRRSHQLPLTGCCATHQEILRSSNVSTLAKTACVAATQAGLGDHDAVCCSSISSEFLHHIQYISIFNDSLLSRFSCLSLNDICRNNAKDVNHFRIYDCKNLPDRKTVLEQINFHRLILSKAWPEHGASIAAAYNLIEAFPHSLEPSFGHLVDLLKIILHKSFETASI